MHRQLICFSPPIHTMLTILTLECNIFNEILNSPYKLLPLHLQPMFCKTAPFKGTDISSQRLFYIFHPAVFYLPIFEFLFHITVEFSVSHFFSITFILSLTRIFFPDLSCFLSFFLFLCSSCFMRLKISEQLYNKRVCRYDFSDCRVDERVSAMPTNKRKAQRDITSPSSTPITKMCNQNWWNPAPFLTPSFPTAASGRL